jgi:hypothetical protein
MQEVLRSKNLRNWRLNALDKTAYVELFVTRLNSVANLLKFEKRFPLIKVENRLDFSLLIL